MWLPLRLTPASTEWLQVADLANEGVSFPQARAALQGVAHQLEQQDPREKAGGESSRHDRGVMLR